MTFLVIAQFFISF